MNQSQNARPLAPPTSTPLSLAMDRAAAERIASVPHDLETLADPQACPAAFLPALGWHVGLEEWDPDWPEAVQRSEIENAIAIARERGTWAAARRLLEAAGAVWTKEEGPPDGLPAMTGRVTIHNGDSLRGARISSLLQSLPRVKRLAFRLEIRQRSGVMASLAPSLGAAHAAAGRVGFE